MANEAEVFETGENMVTFGLEMPLERDLRYKIATEISDSFRLHRFTNIQRTLSAAALPGSRRATAASCKLNAQSVKRRKNRGQQAQARTDDWRLRLGRSLRGAEFNERCGINMVELRYTHQIEKEL